MDIADKARVAKLVGMLTSAFPGEQQNAISMLQKMAAKHKLSLNELIAKAHETPAKQSWSAPPPPPPKPPPPRQSKAQQSNGFHRLRDIDEANENLRKFDQLIGDDDSSDFSLFTDWERQFMRDVAERYDHDYELSDKQLNIVFRILQKAERGGVRWDE